MMKTIICVLWSWKLSGHNDKERQLSDHWEHDLDTLETDKPSYYHMFHIPKNEFNYAKEMSALS